MTSKFMKQFIFWGRAVPAGWWHTAGANYKYVQASMALVDCLSSRLYRAILLLAQEDCGGRRLVSKNPGLWSSCLSASGGQKVAGIDDPKQAP